MLCWECTRAIRRAECLDGPDLGGSSDGSGGVVAGDVRKRREQNRSWGLAQAALA